MDRLLKEVESKYFPGETTKAVEFFKSGPLAKAREALVRNFVVALSKTLLKQPATTISRRRRFAALNAVLEMYVGKGERTLAEVLPELVQAVPDEKLYRVIFFLASVRQSWELIGKPAQMKAEEYIEKAPEDHEYRFLPYAVKVLPLRDLAVKRFPGSEHCNTCPGCGGGLFASKSWTNWSPDLKARTASEIPEAL